MQWAGSKIILILLVVFLFSAVSAPAQIYNYRLQQADSLFNARQFTQSLEHYENIFKKGEYSPAMLLKMAFILEGLNRIGETLYYLNLYYLYTRDESVPEKMEQLSEKYKLQGYTFNDTEKAASIYQRYYFQIAITLAAIIFLLFSTVIFIKRRKMQPVASGIILFMFIILLVMHVNLGTEKPQGIIATGNTYLMAGPSGAATVIDVVNAGHRLEMEKQVDVWIQVRWKGKTAFIKENYLLPVHAL